MSPARTGSSAICRFKGSEVFEICNRIPFDFYTELPHVNRYSVIITSLPVVCVPLQAVQTALTPPTWIMVDPPPPLLSFGAHFHVHPGLPYATRLQ